MKFLLLLLCSVVSAGLEPQPAVNLYATSCTGLLQLYDFGNSTCMTSYLVADFCPDQRFAQSAVQCIYQMIVDVKKVPESSQNRTLQDAYSAFLADCPQYTMDNVNSYRSNSSSLQLYNGNTTGLATGCYPVNAAFTFSDDDLDDAFKALYLANTSEDRNRDWGSGILGYWAAVLLVRALSHASYNACQPLVTRFYNRKLPKFIRRQLIVRNTRHLTEFGVTQLQTMVIVIFVILVILGTFTDLPTSFPNYYYDFNNQSVWSSYIGERSGVLCLSLLPLLILFAGRNNFLQLVTGWPLGPFLLFHKWIARAVMFLLFVHAIAYSMYMASYDYYIPSFKEAYWNWGVVGITFASFLSFQGLRFLRRRAYDLFVVLHIIGASLFLVAGYYHLNLLDEPYGLYYFYACFAVWGFDRFMRLVKVFSAGFHRTALVKLYDNILVVTIDQPAHWQLLNRPGKYMFIHFWQRSIFWQSHPFTLIVNPANPKQLKLFCKVHKGATKMVADQLMLAGETLSEHAVRKINSDATIESTFDMPQKEMKTLLDGPYGHSYNLCSFDECIFIAGGTGITPCFSYIQSFIASTKSGPAKIRLFWAIRVEESAEVWFKDELSYLREYSPMVEVNIHASSSNKKLDVPKVVKDAVSKSTGSTAIMCCGPASMCYQSRESIYSTMDGTSNYVEYFEELFSW